MVFFVRVVATAAQQFFLNRGVNKILSNVCFGQTNSHGIKNYITCRLVIRVTRKPMDQFS